jgi:hypothetical protein
MDLKVSRELLSVTRILWWRCWISECQAVPEPKQESLEYGGMKANLHALEKSTWKQVQGRININSSAVFRDEFQRQYNTGFHLWPKYRAVSPTETAKSILCCDRRQIRPPMQLVSKYWARAGVRLPAEISLFSIHSRPALGPTQPPIEWVPDAVSPGIKRQAGGDDH